MMLSDKACTAKSVVSSVCTHLKTVSSSEEELRSLSKTV